MNKYGNALLEEYYNLQNDEPKICKGVMQLHVDSWESNPDGRGGFKTWHLDTNDYHSDNNSGGGGGGGSEEDCCTCVVLGLCGLCCCNIDTTGDCFCDCLSSIIEGICGSCC